MQVHQRKVKAADRQKMFKGTEHKAQGGLVGDLAAAVEQLGQQIDHRLGDGAFEGPEQNKDED